MKRFLMTLAVCAMVAAPAAASAHATITIHNQSDRSVLMTAWGMTSMHPLGQECVKRGETKHWYSSNLSNITFEVMYHDACSGTSRYFSKSAHPRDVTGGNQEGTFTIVGSVPNYALHGP